MRRARLLVARPARQMRVACLWRPECGIVGSLRAFVIGGLSDQSQRVLPEQRRYPVRHGYYVNTHMPFVEDRCGPAIKGVSVDEGVAGGAPGEGAPYAAIGHLLFGSVEDFQGAFGPHADVIMGDIPNFTRIRPVVQISEIKL